MVLVKFIGFSIGGFFVCKLGVLWCDIVRIVMNSVD